MKFLKTASIFFLLTLVLISITLRVRYGGGEYYPDVSTPPLFGKDSLQIVFEYDEPLGNIAVSKNNRLFFTVHPESWPDKNKVMEVIDGKACPYPNQEFQSTQYQTVLGITIDNQNRLWVVDHGFHGFGIAKIMAFDLTHNKLVYTHIFKSNIAQKGSFFNDLQVSSDGRYVYIADFSFIRKNPSLVVHDTYTQLSKRHLENHYSTTAKDYIIQTEEKDMIFFGLVTLKPSIDGIVVDREGEYVYYAAMAHDKLFRVSTSFLHDFSRDDIWKNIEEIGTKPLSDGLSIDTLHNIYLADVEHNGIARLSPDGKLTTIIKDKRIRWADGLSFGGNGYLYFNDSAMPHQMLQSQSHIKENSPYTIFRIKPEWGGIPGR
ncbi:MAG: major royal jelly family protein [Cyclobacteriaceae bacterium]|nr:major royal jelly family protein [Cyclobacteriaceae bacterium]